MLRLSAGRLSSARRVLSCSIICVAIAAACSSDAPGVVDPAAVDPSALDPSFAVLNLANGPVTAKIESTWRQSQCVTVRGGTMANNTRAELQPCSGTATQKYVFYSTNQVKVGSSNYC